MAKSKKAAPKKNAKKASLQKPLKKTPAPKAKKQTPATKAKKPTPAKSKAPKAKQKAPAKKANKVKAAQPKKASKAKSEDVILHQDFMNSLIKLENYWVKRATLAEKELTSLINKQQKALSAKTPKQIEKAKQFDDEIAAKREAHVIASNEAHKFASLKDNIEQFEAQWSKQNQVLEDEIEEEAEQIVYKQEAASKEAFKTPIRHTPKEIIEEEWVENENIEEESDDLDDIFMPQDDLSEFEVIEDYSVTSEDDLYEEDES